MVRQGYRWYDSHKVAPKYPFGHGLSYSNFSYSGLEVNGMTVSCSVKNTGAVDGTEIAQLYLVRRLAQNPPRRPFTLERLLAIYASIQPESELEPLRVEVLVQLGTLIQQQLVVRVSGESVLEGMRLRCDAPQDTLDAAAEELKFDLNRYFED